MGACSVKVFLYRGVGSNFEVERPLGGGGGGGKQEKC